MRLLPRFDHREAAAEFLAFRPTLFFGVPTIYVRLLSLPDDIAKDIGAFMRLFVSGSAPLPAHVFDAFHERFGHRILERYGMSETLMNCSNPLVGERRAGTVGFAAAGRVDADRRRRRRGDALPASRVKCRSRAPTSLRAIGSARTPRVRRSMATGSEPAISACDRPTGMSRCAGA